MIRLATLALLLLAATFAGCGGNAGDPPATDDAGGDPPTTVAPATGDRGGTITVVLADAPMFVEGFDFGVRVRADGEVVAERLLDEFEQEGETLEDRRWTTQIDVPAGSLTVLSDLTVGIGPGPEPPDFADPCRTDVDVEPGGTATLAFDWDRECLVVQD